MAMVFVNVWHQDKIHFVDLETFVTLYLLYIADSPKIVLKARDVDEVELDIGLLQINLQDLECEFISDIPELATLCKWPVMLLDNYIVSGLCAVARQICKLSNKCTIRNLLGFREACLMACAESSVWTKFCEIDIIQALEELMNKQFTEDNYITLPETIVKYEKHLYQPVRIHNIYKIARDNINDQSLKSSTPRENLSVPHDYAEGPYMSLADAILYPCFHVFFEYVGWELVIGLPLIKRWFNRMNSSNLFKPIVSLQVFSNAVSVFTPTIKNVSLYNADPNRITAEKHTKQYKIENALATIKGCEEAIENNFTPFGFEEVFNWDTIPLEINPKGGSLPQERADRKCEQLENITKAVLKIVGDQHYKIVDFCSGSGHLGLLVAYLIPQSTVILVENKEKSLSRAKETIKKLKLNNVIVVQSNLNYFSGSFDLGIALHACGVASDLTIQQCIMNKADFVCCPCCYGGIKECPELSYPLSEQFRAIFKSKENQYFNLAHAADQTHDVENAKTEQGYFCMDVIDTDRKLFAETNGYKVFLGKLQPTTCTNKNNLLVGLFEKS